MSGAHSEQRLNRYAFASARTAAKESNGVDRRNPGESATIPSKRQKYEDGDGRTKNAFGCPPWKADPSRVLEKGGEFNVMAAVYWEAPFTSTASQIAISNAPV
jgi:hypothetical protein